MNNLTRVVTLDFICANLLLTKIIKRTQSLARLSTSICRDLRSANFRGCGLHSRYELCLSVNFSPGIVENPALPSSPYIRCCAKLLAVSVVVNFAKQKAFGTVTERRSALLYFRPFKCTSAASSTFIHHYSELLLLSFIIPILVHRHTHLEN